MGPQTRVRLDLATGWNGIFKQYVFKPLSAMNGDRNFYDIADLQPAVHRFPVLHNPVTVAACTNSLVASGDLQITGQDRNRILQLEEGKCC